MSDESRAVRPGDESEPGIGVALSGGGYRATLFGLGVLLYLVDARKNRHVNVMSSVSGGSVTNGFVGTHGGLHLDANEFRERVRPLVRAVAHDTLWASPLTWLYLGGVLLLPVALGWAIWDVVPPGWPFRVGLVIALLVLALWLLSFRGLVAGRAYAKKLFRRPGGGFFELEDLDERVQHVICATHLNAGEHLYFARDFVYAWRFGWGRPDDYPVHAAVQASAAFPGGFPPRWISVPRFDFREGAEEGRLPRFAPLTDGGVYDNMADQWPSGVRRRARDLARLGIPIQLAIPEQLVVVNSSAGLGWSEERRLKIPVLGELLALVRVISVMYDNSSALRMQGLMRYRSARMRGVLVTIQQSPLRVPRAFSRGDDDAGRRAKAALKHLDDGTDWKAVVEADQRVKTTLSPLGASVSGRLLRHGYATAMANLHVILDYPLIPLPDRKAFEELAAGGGPELG